MGRVLEEEWGVPCTSEDTVTCVRRLGRDDNGRPRSSRNDHITGVRMAQHNGHEVLLCEVVFIFSFLRSDRPNDHSIQLRCGVLVFNEGRAY